MIFVDIKEDLNNFLKSQAFWICLIVAIFIIITLIVLIVGLVRYHKKNKAPKQEPIGNSNEWLDALGGKENILAVQGIGSRLKLQLKVKENINKQELSRLGVTSIIHMSETIILVIEDKAEKISELLK